jgi:hypothetical protein
LGSASGNDDRMVMTISLSVPAARVDSQGNDIWKTQQLVTVTTHFQPRAIFVDNLQGLG